MVKRSKPRATALPKMSINLDDMELRYLKNKNAELVKALAESKSAYTRILDDRNILQKELFVSNLRCAQLENCIKRMESHSKACMNMIVSASNYTTELIHDAHNTLRVKSAVPEPESLRIDSGSPSRSKTHAVKPMIDGHVIYKPTINLRRVNEISPEEIRRLQSQSEAQSRQNADGNDHSYENQDDNDFENSTPEASSSSVTNNNRLETMHEADEELSRTLSQESHTSLVNSTANSLTLSENSSQLPLLSGVFRDVQVYLSPIQDLAQYLDPCQHVTTERGSRKRFNSPRTVISSAKTSSSQSNLNPSHSSPLPDSFIRKNSLLSSTKLSNGVTTSHSNETATAEDLNWISIAAKYESPKSSRSLDSSDETIRFNTILHKKKKRILTDSTLSTEIDPLEGPSNLLDQQMESKIETLSGERTESPGSPAQALKQRRKLKSTEKSKLIKTSSPLSRKQSNKTKKESLSTKMKQSFSPSSPKVRRMRPRKNINFKEPSITKKMRRSK